VRLAPGPVSELRAGEPRACGAAPESTLPLPLCGASCRLRFKGRGRSLPPVPFVERVRFRFRPRACPVKPNLVPVVDIGPLVLISEQGVDIPYPGT
jgi:hypothetical protein